MSIKTTMSHSTTAKSATVTTMSMRRYLWLLSEYSKDTKMKHTMPSASWDSLPPELVAKTLEMRAEAMFADAKGRRTDAIIASFWATVWRARPRVFRHRLPPVHRHGQPQ
jgi:hypothetical protein